MSFEIRNAAPKPDELPEPLGIFIDGVEVGDCKPTKSGTVMRWHSCIRLRGDGITGVCLVQGFGETPEKAIADGLLRHRQEFKAISERMAWLEVQFGTAGKSDDELQGGAS